MTSPREETELMAANPVVQTYFRDSGAGALRRYCASFALALGAALPLVAPLLALGLFNPWVKLLFEVSTVIMPLSPCYNTTAPTVCPGASRVAYYFWNVSKAAQARLHASCASACTPLLHCFAQRAELTHCEPQCKQP